MKKNEQLNDVISMYEDIAIHMIRCGHLDEVIGIALYNCWGDYQYATTPDGKYAGVRLRLSIDRGDCIANLTVDTAKEFVRIQADKDVYEKHLDNRIIKEALDDIFIKVCELKEGECA